MTEWKKYTGSTQQIYEMWNAKNGYLVRSHEGANDRIRYAPQRRPDFNEFAQHCREAIHVTEYLICNPHPLANMICQQACTGQPVYIQVALRDLDFHISRLIELFRFADPGMDWRRIDHLEPSEKFIFKTKKPCWNIPGAIYSFTPFED